MSTWTSDFELEPAQSRRPSELGFGIRDTKTFVRSRWENEHTSYTSKGGNSGGTITADFVHKAGSARAYYQSATPAVRPDGATTLGSSDAGRLWVNPNEFNLYVWTGTSWINLSRQVYFGEFRVIPPGTSHYIRITLEPNLGAIASETGSYSPRPLLINQYGSWVAVGYSSVADPGATFYVNGTARVSSTLTVNGTTVTSSATVTGTLAVQGGLNVTGLGSRLRTGGNLPPGGSYTIPAGAYMGYGPSLRIRNSSGNWGYGGGFIVSDGSNVMFYNEYEENYSWVLVRLF